jgi:hypothetical protein
MLKPRDDVPLPMDERRFRGLNYEAPVSSDDEDEGGYADSLIA